MKITIDFIPSSQQRYDTLGDWFFEGDDLVIKASGETEDRALLIALHELVEVWLCRKRGISQQVVDEFDMRPENQGDFEPGDLSDAPYRHEHRFAMLIEHLMAHELGLRDYGVVK